MFELIPHTGDIRVRVSAGSVEDLFRDALAAMMHVLDPKPDTEATLARRTVRVTAADRTEILVDFLNEALALSIIGRLAFTDVLFASLGETSLEATLIGTPAVFGDEIKAVTYHEAEVAQAPDGSWTTLIVFDI